jgi:hypothetical protein
VALPAVEATEVESMGQIKDIQLDAILERFACQPEGSGTHHDETVPEAAP